MGKSVSVSLIVLGCLIVTGMLLSLHLEPIVAAGYSGGSTIRISVASDGSQASERSGLLALAEEGQAAVFSSFASNLVKDDTNETADVFVHDFQSQQTILVSRASGGTVGNNFSSGASISRDGRYIAFLSAATNLVPNDHNDFCPVEPFWGPNCLDIFVHDRKTGETTRVSIASDGSEANGGSAEASISANGRYVVFASSANNLDTDDTNQLTDLFIHDRQTHTTRRLVVDRLGFQREAVVEFPVISGDGRFVAFRSADSTLVEGDENGVRDVYVYDRDVDRNGIFDERGQVETRLVSVSSTGEQADEESWSPVISANGRYVAFASRATNLVPDDTNNYCPIGGDPNWNCLDVFVHDLQTGQTERVSVASDGTEANSDAGDQQPPAISANGRYVAFSSSADNLVPNDSNGVNDIFLHDRLTGVTTIASLSAGGVQSNGYSNYPSLSASGAEVGFMSEATNLVPDDTNGVTDAFVRLHSPTTTAVGTTHLRTLPLMTGRVALPVVLVVLVLLFVVRGRWVVKRTVEVLKR